jgi:hypothetical protein
MLFIPAENKPQLFVLTSALCSVGVLQLYEQRIGAPSSVDLRTGVREWQQLRSAAPQ